MFSTVQKLKLSFHSKRKIRTHVLPLPTIYSNSFSRNFYGILFSRIVNFQSRPDQTGTHLLSLVTVNFSGIPQKYQLFLLAKRSDSKLSAVYLTIEQQQQNKLFSQSETRTPYQQFATKTAVIFNLKLSCSASS